MRRNNTNKLDQYRREIERIDAAIFRLCHKRIKTAEKIFKFKQKNKLPLRDLKRESIIKHNCYKRLNKCTTKVRAFKFVKSLIKLNAKYPLS